MKTLLILCLLASWTLASSNQSATQVSRPVVATPGTQGSRPASVPAGKRKPPVAPRLDINRATREQLMLLPGVTEAIAGNIIRARPFKTKVELKTRKIIDVKLYNRIAPRVATDHLAID